MKNYDTSLYKKVIELLKSKEKINVFVDMDGVLSEYKYGEGLQILNGDSDVYLSKRPILTVIKLIKKFYKRNHFIIISSCIKEQQIEAKKLWIKKYLPFFNLNDFHCIVSEDFESRIVNKVKFITEIIKAGKMEAILIEDTHEILKKTWEQNKNLLIPVLVINLIK